MFDRLGFEYEIQHPDFEEREQPGLSPEKQIEGFAYGKAKSVFDTLKTNDDVLILGFDTVIDFNGKIVGKQKTKKQAFETIQSYLGHSMDFISGVAIMGYWKGKKVEKVFHEKSSISFRSDVTNCQIRAYLDFGDWKEKGGGFSVNGPAVFMMHDMGGDFHNIVGVPIRALGRAIEEITGKRIFTVLKPAKRDEVVDGLL